MRFVHFLFIALAVAGCRTSDVESGVKDEAAASPSPKVATAPRRCNEFNASQLQAASVGFSCMTSTGGLDGHGVVFKLVALSRQDQTQIWLDQEANLLIGHVKESVPSLEDSTKYCANQSSWTVPTAYPVSQNAGHDSKDSDLIVLRRDGVLEIAPQISEIWFWVLAPSSPYYQTVRLADPDANGQINYDYGTNDGSISTICVKQN